MVSSSPHPSKGARRKILAALVLSSLTGIISVGCDFACSQPRCERDGLLVSATRADGFPLADGDYQIELTADEESYSAQCMLFEIENGSCHLQALDPDHEQDASLSVAGDDAPRDLRIEVKRAQFNSSNFDLTGPTNVRLAISLDGIVIANDNLSPTYEREEPKGPQCGACEHSEHFVDLLPPPAD